MARVISLGAFSSKTVFHSGRFTWTGAIGLMTCVGLLVHNRWDIIGALSE